MTSPATVRSSAVTRRIREMLGSTSLLLAGIACFAGCSPEPRNLLLVTIDTLRADHLGLYGYPRETSPSIDALGRDGVVFENAIVQWPVTTPSMVSMFSATYPRANGVRAVAMGQWVPDDLVMLPEELRDQGLRTAGVVANSVLGRESNFPQGLDVFREMWLDSKWGGRGHKSAEHVTNAAIRELEALAKAGDAFLLWVHYVDPHAAYRPPEGYAEPYFEDEHFESRTLRVNDDDNPWKGVGRKVWQRAAEETDLGRYIARYDGEIRFLDDHLARLLAALEPLGVADDTLVVLTADHGESLGEHDYYFNHGHVAYEEQVRVPLILRWPGGRYAGRRIEAPVELRGLGPTLLDALGLERGSFAPAASWLAAIRDGAGELPPAVFTAAGSSKLNLRNQSTLVVRRGPLKLLIPRSEWAQAIAGGRSVELYDLSADPGEVRDLAPTRPQLVRALAAEVEAWFDAHPARKPERPPGAPTLREETKRALRELGYMD